MDVPDNAYCAPVGGWSSSVRPTLLFYCQHSLGIGHLTRSFALAQALLQHFRVVFLNGGRLPPGLPVPAGLEIIDLPPLGMDDGHTVVSRGAQADVAAAQACAERGLRVGCFRPPTVPAQRSLPGRALPAHTAHPVHTARLAAREPRPAVPRPARGRHRRCCIRIAATPPAWRFSSLRGCVC